jgi:hypothetical protein
MAEAPVIAVELFAIQSYLGPGILIALVLATALLVPYLVKEIRRGKVELGPRLPTGPSEPNPGRKDNPAPGHPEAQADPYERRAQR